MEKKFKDVQSAVETLPTPVARFRALQTVTDHVYCWSISIKAPVAHKTVLTLADVALKEPMSRSLHTWVKQKRAMSAHMVAATYVGTLEAAAWASDKARFAAALALVDAGDKQGASGARATKSYCAQSAERLAKPRPAFADAIRALGDSLPG